MKHNTIVIWLSVSAVIHVFLLLWMHFTPLSVQQIEGDNSTIIVSIIDPAEAAVIPLPVPPPVNDPKMVINKPGMPQPLGNSTRNVPGPTGKVASNGPSVGATAPPAVLDAPNSTDKLPIGVPGGKGTDPNSTNTGLPGPIGETRGAAIESIGIPIYPKNHTDGEETTVTLSISVGTDGKYAGYKVIEGAPWAENAAVAKAKKGSYRVAMENGIAVAGTITKSWRFNGDGTVTEQ